MSDVHNLSRSPTQHATTAATRKRAGRPAQYYTHAGQTMTLPEWAQALGVPVGTLGHRLRSGWSLDRVLRPARANERLGPNDLTHDDRCQSVRKWALEAGLRVNTLRDRLRAGWTLAVALKTPARPMKQADGTTPVRALTADATEDTRIVWCDEVHSVRGWAKIAGIPLSLALDRIRKGLPVEQVFAAEGPLRSGVQ